MWEELKKTALLGTDRHQIPEKELGYLKKMGLQLDQDPALVLLDALAMWSKMKKVGLELPKWDSLQEKVEESNATAPTLKLTEAIAALFKYNGFEVLLPQTLNLLQLKSVSFPSEMYPELIQYFEKHIAAFLNSKDFLDNRFYWLVQQNPKWTAFRKEIGPEQIEIIKDLELKSLALHQYADINDEEAIGYIYNEWENFSTPLQKSFLKKYQPEQSELADSLFDKIALPKHKDTFRFALRYYSSVQHGPFLESIKPHVHSLLSFQRKKIKVNEEAIKDLKSIFLKKHLPIFALDKNYGFDPKSLFFNFFSLVPVTYLCDTLECTWTDFMKGLQSDNEFHELLLLGLIHSSSQDPMAQELMLQVIMNGQFPIMEDMDLIPLYSQLSSEQLQQIYLSLKKAKFTFNDNAMETLLLCPHFKWPNELCKSVMKVLPVRLLNAEDNKKDPNFIQFRNMVLNCDANLYSYINAAFQANPVYSWNSTKIIEKQLNILKMRWQVGREL